MATVKTAKKQCVGKCGNKKALNNFYNSSSPAFPDGKVNICKACIIEMIDINDLQTVYDVLQLLDVPFLEKYWEKALEKDNPWGSYITMCNSGINEFKGLRFKDSDHNGGKGIGVKGVISEEVINEENSALDDFKVTIEMIGRWGSSYDKEDYLKLESFYNKVKASNGVNNPTDEDYLKKLSVISMKMDKELAAGNYSQAKQLGDLFSKYMADSKFRAMDKSEADKTGGVRSFSMIFAEVESLDFIPPWEHYRKIKNIKQDIVDKSIMHIENFTLRLNRAERMVDPPIDTPKLDEDEV